MCCPMIPFIRAGGTAEKIQKRFRQLMTHLWSFAALAESSLLWPPSASAAGCNPLNESLQHIQAGASKPTPRASQ